MEEGWRGGDSKRTGGGEGLVRRRGGGRGRHGEENREGVARGRRDGEGGYSLWPHSLSLGADSTSICLAWRGEGNINKYILRYVICQVDSTDMITLS